MAKEKLGRQLEPGRGPKRGLKVTIIIFSLLLLLASAGTLVFGLAGFKAYRTVHTEDQVVTVKEGSAVDDVAKQLAEADVVNSYFLFKVYMRLEHFNQVQAGEYEFPAKADYEEILNILKEGGRANTEAQLTIPEGADIEQIADLVGQKTAYSAKEFKKAVQDPKLFQKLLKQYPDLLTDVSENTAVRYKLEGYLYPETYQVAEKNSLEDLISQMVAASAKIEEQHASALKDSDLSWHELLTLASLIEAEASQDEDRAMISGVFRNRLAQDMPLQSDISVLYALNKHDAYVTVEDTEEASPYNLYQHAGLGPGPFNNPGLKAIEAALKPKANDALYFVADLKTGKVYYSKTYEEHLQLVDQYVSPEVAEEVSQKEKPE